MLRAGNKDEVGREFFFYHRELFLWDERVIVAVDYRYVLLIFPYLLPLPRFVEITALLSSSSPKSDALGPISTEPRSLWLSA